MVSRGVLVMLCHGLVVAGAVLSLWAASAQGAAATYGTATPHTPAYNQHKYIPLRAGFDRYDPDDLTSSPSAAAPVSSGLAPSELILTALRTALDVVRKMNARRRTTSRLATPSNRNATSDAGVREWCNSLKQIGNGKVNATTSVERLGRGFYDEYEDHHHDHETTTAKPAKQSRYTDPWAGYYDWIINEGSFKFWSVFQLFTAALLLYACFSAIYYAKFNPIIPDYDHEYDDYFLERTVGGGAAGRGRRSLLPADLPSGLAWINPTAFQFIMDAIAMHYKEE